MAKPHRINKNALQTPKKLGGLALPNLMYYYWHKREGGKAMSQADMTSAWKWKITAAFLTYSA